MLLLTIFGGISVALAVIGLFGMMANAVSQRTNEIGIRMALGAPPANVLGLVLRQGLVVTAAGLVVGLGASLVLTRAIQGFLWGVTATDPLTFALVGSGLAAVALLACYLPARRASHIDPVIALRSE
jgi:putative ABC transport system permease protein